MKYEILQIKKALISTGTWLFMDYDYAKEHDFDVRDYEVVYSGNVAMNKSIHVVLEDLFTKFNIDRPEDFKGHSMSVSDLIRLEDGRIFYVDSVGFTPVQKA